MLTDGTLEVTLADGSIQIVEAGAFAVTADGGVWVAGDVAEALLAVVDDAGGLGDGALAAGAALGVVAVLAGGSEGVSANTPAAIGGVTTGGVTEDAALTGGNLTASGALTVTDADTGQAVFAAQASATGTYGTFTLSTAGAWTYSADNAQAAIQALGAGETLTDSFTAVTGDGTEQVVTVTITGVNEAGLALALSDIELGQGGFVINGVSAGDNSGGSVSAAGDVNGDGFDDLIVGAFGDDPNGSSSGASFVVFGKTNGTKVELSAVEAGTGGFVINGVSAGDTSGTSVSSAGDVNGDGFDDLIVGAFGDDPNGSSSGASFVVFGKTDGTKVELSDVEAGTGGFVINGVSADDSSGGSVSAAGDVNGDGFDDLIVGANRDDPNGSSSGASFVVFGGNFTGAVTEIGTVGDDALVGTAANDVIFAGTGSDTLDGGGGTDRLWGGAGADTFTLRNLDGTTTVIDFDGGEGDKLDVSNFGLANFAAFEALLSAEGPGGHDTRITFDAETVASIEDMRPGDLVASHVLL